MVACTKVKQPVMRNGFQESTNKPLPRAGEKSGRLSDYGHRSQISAGRYLQENPENEGTICWAIICSDGCQLHITAFGCGFLKSTVEG